MNQKQRLERSVLDRFLEAYNQLNGTHLRFRKHSDKPDFIAEDSTCNHVIGIEVTHLYYDPDEAKILLGRSSKNNHDSMYANELIVTLNKRLQNKTESARKYKFKHKMLLIVGVASPIFDKSTFDRYGEDIIIPAGVFDEVWLVFRNFSTEPLRALKRLK